MLYCNVNNKILKENSDEKYILLASAVLAVGLATTTSDTNPFFVSTVRADEQTLTTAAKYYIIVPNDSEVFKNWKGTVNRPIISATKLLQDYLISKNLIATI